MLSYSKLYLWVQFPPLVKSQYLHCIPFILNSYFTIFFFLFQQRTKIWAKYSKDIETYVDKRAHLGEDNLQLLLDTGGISEQG